MTSSGTSFGTSAVVGLASDHAGFDMKQALAAFLREQGAKVVDLGPETADRVDYPDYAYRLAEAVAAGDVQCGIGICGSGIGISVALNRHPAVRAALCTSVEMAVLSRQHNDANVLALGARLTDIDTAKACVRAFLETDFEGGRHADRVAKLGVRNDVDEEQVEGCN